MSKEMKIIFKGEEYLFIAEGSSLEDGGAIVTQERADNFEAAYAYLDSNGIIVRAGEIIGTIKDILVIDDESEEIN